MKTASITEAKNRLSALIDQVRHGQSVLILDRGTPVARLESVVTATGPDSEGRLARLRRQGLVNPGNGRAPRGMMAEKPPRLRKGSSGLAALLDERRAGR
jgi:prevent-host-death family protein